MKIHKNWRYQLLALLLAFFTWYLISGRERVETWVQMPIELVNLPEDLVIREGMVNRLEVRVRGPKSLVRALNTKDLAYTMDMSGLEQGRQTLALQQQNIPISRALQVMEIRPSRVELLVDQLMAKTVPVNIDWSAELDSDFQFIEGETEPQRVELEGPSTLVEPLQAVSTKPVTVHGKRPRQWQSTVGLEVSPEVEVRPATVQVRLKFGPKTTTLWVKRPVRLTGLSKEHASISPEKVRLHLELPLPLLDQEGWREAIRVTVPGGELGPGVYQRAFDVDVPADTRILEVKPEQLRVVVEAPKNATAGQTSPAQQEEPDE
ncbi:MAG: CdaR family protein [Thermodesulfobacteriota bacterium]